MKDNKGILNDIQIRELCMKPDITECMIDPFVFENTRMVDLKRVISYGCSSYGYDMRIARKFKIFTNINNTIIDPKSFDKNSIVDYEGDSCIIPPHSYILAQSVEYFRMPKDVMAICLGKSTYARCGIIVNVTPLEPAWEGYLTIEISNSTSLPVRVYANEGISQLIFFRGEECSVNYKDRGGKYDKQKGIETAKL